MQDKDERQHPADTGMLGSDDENPGPGRDTRPTDTDREEGSRPVGMSEDDPERTRLGTQDTDLP